MNDSPVTERSSTSIPVQKNWKLAWRLMESPQLVPSKLQYHASPPRNDGSWYLSPRASEVSCGASDDDDGIATAALGFLASASAMSSSVAAPASMVLGLRSRPDRRGAGALSTALDSTDALFDRLAAGSSPPGPFDRCLCCGGVFDFLGML